MFLPVNVVLTDLLYLCVRCSSDLCKSPSVFLDSKQTFSAILTELKWQSQMIHYNHKQQFTVCLAYSVVGSKNRMLPCLSRCVVGRELVLFSSISTSTLKINRITSLVSWNQWKMNFLTEERLVNTVKKYNYLIIEICGEHELEQYNFQAFLFTANLSIIPVLKVKF